jgi:hypothetical protein
LAVIPCEWPPIRSYGLLDYHAKVTDVADAGQHAWFTSPGQTSRPLASFAASCRPVGEVDVRKEASRVLTFTAFPREICRRIWSNNSKIC